jgi:cyclopropane-fatty-acyl-phospholipid synthase
MEMIDLAERGLIPDVLIRKGIRNLLKVRLGQEWKGSEEQTQEGLQLFFKKLADAPIALRTTDSKEQHYEVPTEFFLQTLGPRLKYSSCFYDEGVRGLAQAEERMLSLTCERAGISNGMKVLELGCGWGSLSLWMAEKYPGSEITAVSHSKTQKALIDERARSRGLGNLTVITQDMNDFSTNEQFDRVVSVEMFEHMRNWPELFRRVSTWLKADGRFFMHVFCHKRLAYFFEDQGADNWMGRYFFSGGLMPSRDMPFQFSQHLGVRDHWVVDGRHYAQTSEDWLKMMDVNRATIMRSFSQHYGSDAGRWFQRWRMFFMACAELFDFNDGQEWFVAHYLLAPHHR